MKARRATAISWPSRSCAVAGSSSGRKVRERLGALDSEKAISLIAIHSHQIPHVFRPEAIAEAERARPLSWRIARIGVPSRS